MEPDSRISVLARSRRDVFVTVAARAEVAIPAKSRRRLARSPRGRPRGRALSSIGAMRVGPWLARREAIVSALVAFGITQPLAPRSASAAYTVVTTGSVSEKRARLTAVEKEFIKKPDDPYISGEKAQLEYDIGALEKNSAFTKKLKGQLADGTAVFPQAFTVGVPDMAAALQFWTAGVGCLVLSTRLNADKQNVTRVGFGPQSLNKEDGGKFALELVESPGVTPAYLENSVVQYLQLGISVFRLSQVYANGGEIESAYGWSSVTAPGGLPLRVRIDEDRRDPFEFVALRTSDIKKAKEHYESLGMVAVSTKEGGLKLRVGESSWGIARVTDAATEPDREPGAIQMSFGDPQLSTGLLLLPPKKRAGTLLPGTPPPTLQLVGKAPAAAGSETYDGMSCPFIAEPAA